MKGWMQLLASAFLLLFGISLGANFEQAHLSRQVFVNTDAIIYLKEADQREIAQRVAYQESFDKRLIALVTVVDRVIEQNSLLLAKLNTKVN
jgi:hypothetical protein